MPSAVLPDDWWTTENVASYLGVATSTVRAYVVRNQMPKPQRSIGRNWLWKPETIKEWHQARPRQSADASAELHLLH
jgi:excisionase family DNA binding protein